MEDIIMIFTEETKSTIKFGSKFVSADYFNISKVIVVVFKYAKEAQLFKNAIINKYIAMFEVEKTDYAVMLKVRDGVTVTDITIDDKLSCLSIQLSYTGFYA